MKYWNASASRTRQRNTGRAVSASRVSSQQIASGVKKRKRTSKDMRVVSGARHCSASHISLFLARQTSYPYRHFAFKCSQVFSARDAMALDRSQPLISDATRGLHPLAGLLLNLKRLVPARRDKYLHHLERRGRMA